MILNDVFVADNCTHGSLLVNGFYICAGYVLMLNGVQSVIMVGLILMLKFLQLSGTKDYNVSITLLNFIIFLVI